MNLNKKKLAREILFLYGIIAIFFITYGILILVNTKVDNNRQVLRNEKLALVTKLDSIYKLPWNREWGSKRSSNDSLIILDLTSKLKFNIKETSKLSNFDNISILRQLCIILFLIAYPIRGLILLLLWSVKTIKE